MENILEIYHPVNAGLGQEFWLAVLGAFGLLIVAYFLQRKDVKYENRNLRNLLVMLSLFGTMLCVCVIIFSWFNNQKISTVRVFENGVQYDENTITFNQLKKAYLHDNKQSSHLSTQIIIDTSYLLVIEEMSGKAHVFSEDHYPIKEMVVVINEAEQAFLKKHQ